MFIPSPGMLTPSDTRPSARCGYKYNPNCACAWCEHGGANPTPGAPAALGYDEPHIPPASSPFRPA